MKVTDICAINRPYMIFC